MEVRKVFPLEILFEKIFLSKAKGITAIFDACTRKMNGEIDNVSYLFVIILFEVKCRLTRINRFYFIFV